MSLRVKLNRRTKALPPAPDHFSSTAAEGGHWLAFETLLCPHRLHYPNSWSDAGSHALLFVFVARRKLNLRYCRLHIESLKITFFGMSWTKQEGHNVPIQNLWIKHHTGLFFELATNTIRKKSSDINVTGAYIEIFQILSNLLFLLFIYISNIGIQIGMTWYWYISIVLHML